MVKGPCSGVLVLNDINNMLTIHSNIKILVPINSIVYKLIRQERLMAIFKRRVKLIIFD